MKSKQKCWLIASITVISFFSVNLSAQVTIGDLSVPNEQAVLELKSGVESGGTSGAKGLLLPRVRLTSKTDPTPFVNTPGTNPLVPGIVVYNTEGVARGFGYYTLTPGLYVWTGTEWESTNNESWFYMPSTLINTEVGVNKTLNLYNAYVSQFGVQTHKSVGAPDLFVEPPLAATDFYYYVIGYTETVFSNISITSAGVMTYNVDEAGDDNTFINIVFVKKY